MLKDYEDKAEADVAESYGRKRNPYLHGAIGAIWPASVVLHFMHEEGGFGRKVLSAAISAVPGAGAYVGYTQAKRHNEEFDRRVTELAGEMQAQSYAEQKAMVQDAIREMHGVDIQAPLPVPGFSRGQGHYLN